MFGQKANREGALLEQAIQVGNDLRSLLMQPLVQRKPWALVNRAAAKLSQMPRSPPALLGWSSQPTLQHAPKPPSHPPK